MTTTVKRIIFAVLAIILVFLLARYTNIFTSTPSYWELSEGETQELQTLRRKAYDYAVRCSGTDNPALKFEEIQWVLIPGDRLVIPTVEGKDARLLGWFNPSDSTIYIPFTRREEYWLQAHESMHAIGYMGHPYIPFNTCSLMADQNP